MSRRLWLSALCLYALGIVVDVGVHLRQDRHLGSGAIGYPEVVVAFAAGLFWPADLVAAFLLASPL
jgi:hypothetical protein